MSKTSGSLHEYRSSTVFITFVVCYTVFVDQLYFAFLLPVLPYSLASRNGIAQDKVQYWASILIITYGVAAFITCPLIGWWTDRHSSRRVPWLCSLLLLFVSTFLMWLSKSIALQLLSRVLQGMTTSMVYIVGITIIVDTVTTEHVAEYMGHIAMALNVGTCAGPLLGGLVFKKAGYSAVWWMMLGFVAVGAALRFLMLEKEARQKMNSVSSEASSISSEMGLTIPCGINQAHFVQDVERRDRLTLTNHAAAMSTSEEGDLPSGRSCRMPTLLTLTFSMRMVVALYGVCVQSMIFSGFETVLALYVQEVFRYDSLGAGLMFIPLTLPSFISPLLGRVIDRTRPQWAIVLGFVGLCPVLVLARFVTYNSMRQKVLLCALLFLVGLGITVVLNPLMAEICYVAEAREKCQRERQKDRREGSSRPDAFAQAYALFLMAFALGNVVGPLMAGLIKDIEGWGTMCWVLGILSGTTAVPCLLWSGYS